MLPRNAGPRSCIKGHWSLVANLCLCVTGTRPRRRQHVHHPDGNLATNARRYCGTLYLERYITLSRNSLSLIKTQLTPLLQQASFPLRSVTCLVALCSVVCITGGCTAVENSPLLWTACTTIHTSACQLCHIASARRIWNMDQLDQSPRTGQVQCDCKEVYTG